MHLDSTNTRAISPRRGIYPNKPHADIDPPWDSDLLNSISPATFALQYQSRLFTLPTEIRLEIFALVLSPYEDTLDPYIAADEHSYVYFFEYYRPGCTAPMTIDTALLYTCRRVFYDACHIPMTNTTHRFYLYMYAPPTERKHSNGQMYPLDRFCRLTRRNLADITHVQFIAEPFATVESQMNMVFFDMWEYYRGPDALSGLRKVTITIPWTGWYVLEGMPVTWSYSSLDDDGKETSTMNITRWPNGLELVRFELEVPESNVDRMEELSKIVANLKRDVVIKLKDGTRLALARSPAPKAWRWTIPRSLIEEAQEELDLSQSSDEYGLQLYVAVIEWKR